MAGLLAPYIPDSSEWFKSAQQGYALGETMRNRNLRVDAGGQAAEGDLRGAKATLYKGGDFEGGNQIHQLMRQASDDALKKTEKFHQTLGNLALAADTPEKWAAAVGAAGKAGIDVSKYGDFNARQMVLAQSGKTIEAIGLENDRRKAAAAANKPVEMAPGNTLVDPITQKPIFTAPMKPEPRPELARRAEEAGLVPGSPEYQKYVLAGPPKTATEKWNEGQSKAANFGNMMAQAEVALASVGPKDEAGKLKLGPDGKPVPAENPKNFLGATRDAVVPFEGLRNVMTPNDTQEYTQIARQWIRAKLRKESGAAIGKDEMAQEFTTYFPQYGDGPDVLKRKAAAREEATKGMIAESSGAYDHFFGGGGKNQGKLAKDEDAATSKELVQVTKEQYDALEPGDRYLDPKGNIRTKAGAKR